MPNTIETANYNAHGQAINPGDETRTGSAQRHPTEAKQEAGTPVDSLTLSENAKAGKYIASLPVVDSARVEKITEQLSQRSLQILSGNVSERLQSASNILDKMVALEAEIDPPSNPNP